MKSKQELLFEIKTGIFLLALAVIYVILTLVGIDTRGRFLQGNAGLNPTTFPYFIGTVFTLSSFYVLCKAVIQYRLEQKKKEAARARGEEIPEEKKSPFPFPVKAALIPYIAFIVYIAVLKLLGFMLDTILLSVFILFYLNKKNRIRNIIFSIIFPILVFLLFNKVLYIRLPIGVIFGGRA